MAKTFTIQDFFARFPDDAACLEHLMRVRYGDVQTCTKCGKEGRFAKLSKLPAYSCPWCGHHIHPMAGTPFERSSTPLQKWFYAMYMFTTTRNGVAAKEVQRQLGVTYKTAWRIGQELRKYMGFVDGDRSLGGRGGPVVEIDQTFIGGYDPRGTRDDKFVVLGMIERGGEVLARHVPTRNASDALPEIKRWVKPGSRVATDSARMWKSLAGNINTAWSIIPKRNGCAMTCTPTLLRVFWAALKRGINGTHIWVSAKHLQKYLWEFEFRHNLRRQPHLMFDLLLVAFPRPRP